MPKGKAYPENPLTLVVGSVKGKKKSYTIGGFIVDKKYFAGRDADNLALHTGSNFKAYYAIYNLKGDKLLGGLDSAKDAKSMAHLWVTKEKFKI